MAKEEVLTPEGFKKLQGEIEHLRTEKRREVAERIKAAREFGDISENAEYDHAKNEQAMLEAQISRLEEKLRSATILDQKSVEKGVVSVGSKVQGQGPEVGQVGPLPDRRLGGGRSGREQGVERVAGRAGAARPQVRRHRHRSRAPRPEPQAQDHEDRSGVAAVTSPQ